MRLIDADKLESELFDADWMMDNDEHMVEKIVERQPTVDAEPFITGETSDGYHTFNELYHHRAVLFSVIVKAFEDKAWKSRKHHDGTMYDGMFIVGIETPDGQATYHYDIEPYWDMFQCKELEYAPEWDGHTPAQAIERIGKLEPVRHAKYIHVGPSSKGGVDWYRCSNCGTLESGVYVQHPFCSICGAKMDEGEQNVAN